MGRTTNLLDSADDATVNNKFQLLPLCDPGSGISAKMTIEQAKKAFGTFKIKYVATGSEGSTLTITELANMEIIQATRENNPLYEVDSSPDPAEFTFDGTDVTLGVPVGGAGERFLFLYKNPI